MPGSSGTVNADVQPRVLRPPWVEDLIRRLNWQRFFRGEGPEHGPVTLDRHRVFILPTREGVMFAVVLLAMLLGAINYSKSLAFMMTFLLAGLGISSMLHTYRNMVKLSFRAGNTMPVFAGGRAGFQVVIDNRDGAARHALQLELTEQAPVLTDVPQGTMADVMLARPAPRRGRLEMGRFTISTRFPLGLFRAWSYLDLSMSCVVYPKPGPHRPLPPAASEEAVEYADRGQGAEDFRGLRDYVPGDSPRHVHWKASARNRRLLTKLFAAEGSADCWLDWEQLPGLDVEARLSALCRWVLEADNAGISYGLRLPDSILPPGSGEQHRHKCLSALALYGLER